MSYTAQQIVDTVYLAFHPDHVGLPLSYDPLLQRCLYAGPNGTGCAVGVLLPRSVARTLDSASSSEGIPSIATIMDGELRRYGMEIEEAGKEVERLLGVENRYLLQRLQGRHDSSSLSPSRHFSEAVQLVAKKKGLLDPARPENAGRPVDEALADLLGEAFQETHDNLIPA